MFIFELTFDTFPWFDLSNAFLSLVSLFCKHCVVTYQIRLFDERTTHAQKNTQGYRKREQEQAWKSGKWLVRKEEAGAWLEKKRDAEHIDASQINQISNKTNVKKQKKKNKKISNQYADCSAVPYETNDDNNIWDCVFE